MMELARGEDFSGGYRMKDAIITILCLWALFSIAQFALGTDWIRYLNVIGAVACMMVATLLAAPRALFPAECRNAPKVVPYRPGMSLCPGQETRIIIDLAPHVIPMPRPMNRGL
jgi:hypothetical protein